jgi:hypothetical protein
MKELVRIKPAIINIKKGSARYSYSPSFNTQSQHYLNNGSVTIYDWNTGPGTGLPNNWLHKGQAYYNNERKLYDQLNTEFVNLNGMVGEYFVTTYDKDYDRIYGEDNNRRYVRKFDFMFFSDEMFEPDYTNNMYGLYADNTYTIDVAKNHFLEASRYGSDPNKQQEDELSEGFTYSEEYNFEPYQPHVGDFIKIKSVGLYYEVNNVKNRYTSLQGTSFWSLTLIPMKENQESEVSNELGMGDQMMQDIGQLGTQRKEDLDLFDMTDVVKYDLDKNHYKENPNTQSDDQFMQDATGSESTEPDGLNWN